MSLDPALLSLLPEARIGVVERIEPITLGLSGAGVYAVTTSRGAYVLRVQRRDLDPTSFAQQMRILKRVSDAGIAPALLHVDEEARATIVTHVTGMPMAAAMGDPAKRGPVLGSIVDRLRVLHGLDASDVAERDPLPYARAAWEAMRVRPGFPAWIAIEAELDGIAATLASDSRRALSHNDVNPMNVLWDGMRTWLVDWEVAGRTHPHYDFAVLALFLRLPNDAALDLLARHDGAPLDAPARASFHALRKLAGLLCGLTFLSLVEDLGVLKAESRGEAPSLSACYEAMRAGTFDMHKAESRMSFGLALLTESLA